MICGAETRHNIALGLGLAADPHGTSTWADDLFTCTYRLPQGALVLSVKQLSDDSAAQGYLNDLVRAAGEAKSLQGVASLGLPGYETPSGIVLFRKDNMTLQVNAADLPKDIAAGHMSPDDFAYQVATDILACWSGK
jgi:hypothetical protein